MTALNIMGKGRENFRNYWWNSVSPERQEFSLSNFMLIQDAFSLNDAGPDL